MAEETGVPGGKHRPAASHWQTLAHNVVSSTSRLGGIRTHNVSLMLFAVSYTLKDTHARFCVRNILFQQIFNWRSVSDKTNSINKASNTMSRIKTGIEIMSFGMISINCHINCNLGKYIFHELISGNRESWDHIENKSTTVKTLCFNMALSRK